jgi:hypothetical protein
MGSLFGGAEWCLDGEIEKSVPGGFADLLALGRSAGPGTLLARRGKRLAGGKEDAMLEPIEHPFLEDEWIRFLLFVGEDAWQLDDKRAGVSWGNAAEGGTWVAVQRPTPDGAQWMPLALHDVEQEETALHCRFLDAEGEDAALALTFRLAGEALQLYVVPDEGTACPSVRLFTHGLEASADRDGDALLPIRMGLLVPAAGEEAFDLRLGTYEYEGAHMAMAGLLKSGAALMVTWGDPYVALHLSRAIEPSLDSPRLRMSVTLAKTARSLQVHCLGPGDLATLAAAYRERAEALGYRVPWAVKRQERPQVDRLFGACNVKLWHALARRVDVNLVEQSVEVNWTFDEAAQIAEHLRHDLELRDVLFHLGGWTRYGYDCKHPDIMPANPECGGDEGLANCARRVQDCGYLFCLHDNYQDMYRDAPSWGEAWLEREADGTPHLGGIWLGGQAYYTCAREAVKLAQRPENLRLVREVAHPDLYFIDTTYAVGPQECFDPRHPLTRQDDIHWKQVLSDYAREVFGMFGSECGREWAVSHADFFEGLASVSGRYYHMLDPDEYDGRVVPFFDMVFRDCIAIHGKYGYRPEEMGEQVIHHVAMGRTLYYHSLGKHLYWQDTAAQKELPFPEGPYDPAAFTRAHNGWAEGLCLWDRFIKNTHEVLGPLNALTAETLIERYAFLDEARLIRETTFRNGVRAVVNGSEAVFTASSPLGERVRLPPYGFLVEAGTFAAFHALSWGGRAYHRPVLFTLTSLDGKPLAESGRVRVYHGFGDAQLAWRGETVEVRREEILE